MDVDVDIQDTELSPGARRMMAAVGQEAAFDRGREQLKLLADLTLTTKAVERTAEAIGEDNRTPSAAGTQASPAAGIAVDLYHARQHR